MDGPKVRLWVGIAFASLHIGISILWSLVPELLNFNCCPLIFVQSSLLGMWVMLGQGHYWIRLPISFLLLLWSGHNYYLSIIVTGSNPLEAFVSIEMMIWGQYLFIIGLIFLLQAFMKLMRKENLLESTKYSLINLLIAIAVIAATICFGKFMIQQFGFITQVFSTNNKYFWFPPFLGIFNVLAVAIMLPSLLVHRWQTKLILIIPSLLLVALISGIEDQLFRNFFYNGYSWYTFPGICLAQSIVFYITVFPLWRWKTESKEENPVIIREDLNKEELKGVSV